MTDNNTFLAVSPADFITQQQKQLTVLENSMFVIPFLVSYETTLNIKVSLILRVGRKWKGRAEDNFKSTLNIEFKQDWLVGLCVALRDR